LMLGNDVSGNSHWLTLGKGYNSTSGIRWRTTGHYYSAINSDANENLNYIVNNDGALPTGVSFHSFYSSTNLLFDLNSSRAKFYDDVSLANQATSGQNPVRADRTFQITSG